MDGSPWMCRHVHNDQYDEVISNRVYVQPHLIRYWGILLINLDDIYDHVHRVRIVRRLLWMLLRWVLLVVVQEGRVDLSVDVN